MVKFVRRVIAVLLLVSSAAVLRPARAETCLSPFVKRLDRLEQYLYVYCVDTDAKDNDFLAVVDVRRESPTSATKSSSGTSATAR